MNLDEQSLIVYLREELHVDGEIDGHSGLFSTGALDSVAMMNLIGFIEQAAGIEIRPQDVTLENFDTPDRIVRFARSQS